MKRLHKIKRYTPYVRGIVGEDIALSLWERIRILFSGGIQVNFISESLRKEAGNDQEDEP